MTLCAFNARNPPAPLTPEDRDIWVCVGLWGPFTLKSALEAVSMYGDRRDAELIYRLTITGAETAQSIVGTNAPFRAVVHSLLSCGMEVRLL